MKPLLALTFMLCFTTAQAEDWTIKDKTFHNVVVGQIEADRVHITYDGGLGTVQLADLPPDLQKRFNYNPNAAKAAIQQRETDRQAAEVAVTQQNAAIDAHNRELQAEQATETSTNASSNQNQAPAIDRAAIQAKIDSLEDDIREKRRMISGTGTHGAYEDQIAADRHQIRDLEQQLNQSGYAYHN
jgi:hypothetical protein